MHTVTFGNLNPEMDMILEKLGAAANVLLRYQELETGQKTTKETLDILGSPASAMNFILDNYSIITRSRFNAISGFLCNNCQTFQFEYIKDMGFDLIAAKRHRCLDAKEKQATFIGRGSGRPGNELYLEAVNHMIKLTEFLFRGQKFLISQPISHVNPDTYPVFDSMPMSDLPLNAINHGKIPLTHEILEEFIKLSLGTYAVFPLAGTQPHSHYSIYVANGP